MCKQRTYYHPKLTHTDDSANKTENKKDICQKIQKYF